MQFGLDIDPGELGGNIIHCTQGHMQRVGYAVWFRIGSKLFCTVCIEEKFVPLFRILGIGEKVVEEEEVQPDE